MLAPKIALAPNFDLFAVPSRKIIAVSSVAWSPTSIPIRRSRIGPLTLATAASTPLPTQRDLSPSRSSRAS